MMRLLRWLLFILMLALPLAAARAQEEQYPFNSIETVPGVDGVTECITSDWDGPAYVIETGEIWNCDHGDGLWHKLVLQSEAVPADHATKHMTGGDGTDPLGVFTNLWSRSQTFTPSTDEIAVTINPTGPTQTADVVKVTDKNAVDALRVVDTGHVLVNAAAENARLAVKGNKWTPTTADAWFVAADLVVPLDECGSGDDQGVDITSVDDWDDRQGNYTLTPVSSSGDYPEFVCGACCQGTIACDDNWSDGNHPLPTSDCDDFTQSTGIGSHVEVGNGEYFTLTPTPGLDAVGEGLTFVGLMWGGPWGSGANVFGHSTDTWLVDAFDKGGSACDPDVNRDWNAQARIDSCGGGAVTITETLLGECPDCDASTCTDESITRGDAEGIGDWHVYSFALELKGIAPPPVVDEVWFTTINVNGTDVSLGGVPFVISGCSTSAEFDPNRMFDGRSRVVEFMFWESVLSAAEIEEAENYLAYKYQLGDGLDPINDNLDDTDPDVQTDDALYCESVNAGDYTKVDSDGRLVVVKGTTTSTDEQIKWCFGPLETNCCEAVADATGDGTLTCDGGDITISGLVPGAAGDVLYSDGGGGFGSEAAFNYDAAADELAVEGVTLCDGTAADCQLTFDTDGTEYIKWNDSESGFEPSAKLTYPAGDRILVENRQYSTAYIKQFLAASSMYQRYTLSYEDVVHDGVGGTHVIYSAMGGTSSNVTIDAVSIFLHGFISKTGTANLTVGTGGRGTGAISLVMNHITTANSGDDVTMPGTTQFSECFIANTSGWPVDVYAPTGVLMNATADGTSVTLADDELMHCLKIDPSGWFCGVITLPIA